jgi:hypothetical protein
VREPRLTRLSVYAFRKLIGGRCVDLFVLGRGVETSLNFEINAVTFTFCIYS